MKEIFKKEDRVKWSGKIIEKGKGFVWKELYESLFEDKIYTIIDIMKYKGDYYYQLVDPDDNETYWFPEEVFYISNKNRMSEKYDLR